MQCLTEHVFVILGGGWVVESIETKGYGSVVIGLGCAHTSHLSLHLLIIACILYLYFSYAN